MKRLLIAAAAALLLATSGARRPDLRAEAAPGG
jgi:hypothetical protein